MKLELTSTQSSDQERFRSFVDQEVVPNAARYDREERLDRDVIGKMAERGLLATVLPREWGGQGRDMLTFGLLCEEVGRGCPSLQSFLTVHGMVTQTILRWGSDSHRERWIARLSRGDSVAAFALTEPEVGSDARNVATNAKRDGDCFLLSGRKKWISFGQLADLFLVFAQCDGKPCALLVERGTPGFEIRPITGMLGFRASMLAELQFTDCRVPADQLIGRVGFGFSPVAAMALDHGRYSVAWGCVGIAQACLEASAEYTHTRRQFGVYLREHQLICRMLSEMIANLTAARMLCCRAGCFRDVGHPQAVRETLIAKYFASTMVNRVANDAVQIHGARGYSNDYPVERYLRDARAMEIIEGSTEIQQISIAKYAHQDLPVRAPVRVPDTADQGEEYERRDGGIRRSTA